MGSCDFLIEGQDERKTRTWGIIRIFNDKQGDVFLGCSRAPGGPVQQ